MRIVYHKTMKCIKENLWSLWHWRLRNFFDRKFYGTDYYGGDHAWWMLCCNGNAGGWRTKFCDGLEDYRTGWRYHEACIDKLNKVNNGEAN